MSRSIAAGAVVLLAALSVLARTSGVSIAPADLDLVGVKATAVSYCGRPATRLTEVAGTSSNGEALAVVHGTDFQDGTIEVMLSGDTLPTADDTARGFVEIAFHVSVDRSHFECFYLRPKNGRAQDQLRRNHSIQYASLPDFPWNRLRAEAPGQYESYADLVPGEWTRLRIEVKGAQACLYVNGAQQPALMVGELKHESSPGAVALWIGPGTVAHFAALRINGNTLTGSGRL